MSGSVGDNWVDDPTDAPVDGGYGEAIVGAQGRIFLAQTHDVGAPNYFYSYNPATNAWTSLSVSGLPGAGTGDFRNGAALVWDNGNYVYSLLGGKYTDTNRYYFYRYSIIGNSWVARASTPTSAGQQSAGGALAWVPGSVLGVGDDNYIYAFVGNHSSNFLRYSVKNNTWTSRANAPGGVDDGGSLVWTGDNYIYALQGEFLELGYNDAAWRYNIITNTWDLTGKFATEVGDGGSMIWTGGDYIYATSGAKSNEDYRKDFYRYNFKTGSLKATDWVRLADLPEDIGYVNGCRIGFTWTSIGSSVGDIYAWRGTPEDGKKFWMYNMPGVTAGSWTQTDWSGGPTKPNLQVGTWSGTYDNFYDNENVDWSQVGRVRLENFLTPASDIADHVVISEVYADAIDETVPGIGEFIELYNPTSSAIVMTNWKIGDNDGWVSTFSGTIPAYGFFVIAINNYKNSSDGMENSWPDPDFDANSSIARMANTGDEVWIMDGAGNVVDVFGYTAAAENWEGTKYPQMSPQGQSYERKSSIVHDNAKGNGYDTDNNANDFYIRTTPQPQNTSSAAEQPPATVLLFRSAGWFESSIFDAGQVVYWKTVSWNESKPSGTSIVVKLRTGNDNDPYDGGWSGWYSHTNGAENTLMPDGRYVQYRVELSTTDNTKTPELFDILINYNLDNTPPPTPSLVSPTDGKIISDNTPTFTWTSVADPSGVTYDIQVDNDPNFSSPEVDVTGLVSSTYTPPALADENYSWRVRAVDGVGNVGDWSSVWTLLIYTQARWTQTDWKGGPTKPSLQVGTWSDTYDNFYDNENVDWSQAGKVRLENTQVVIENQNVLTNSGFETGNPPNNWTGVTLEGTSTPNLGTAWERFADAAPPEGTYVARAYARGDVVGWMSYAGQQSVGSVSSGNQIWLKYWVRRDYIYNTSNMPNRGAAAEIEFTSGGTTYKLRYFHAEAGAPPADSATIKYITGSALTTSWASYTKNVNSDINTKFGISSFTINAVRVASMAYVQTAGIDSRYRVSWDNVVLLKEIVPTYKNGWFESSIYDAGEVVDWKLVSWSESKPTETNVIVKLRTGNDNDPYDGGWSGWYLHTNGSENIQMENGRYVQYRVELSTTDNTKTPELLDIMINYWIDLTPPEAPTLVWPASGSSIADNCPNLDWNPVSDDSPPVLYHCYVDNDDDFSSIDYDSGWIVDDNYKVPSVLAEGWWYWKVQAKDNAGNIGDNSDIWGFYVDVSAPLTPSLVSPQNGENILDNTPTFVWASVADPSGVIYQIQIDDNSDFSSPVYSVVDLTETTYTVPDELPMFVQYFWRVRAVDGVGNIGDWSETWSFGVVPMAAIGAILMPLFMLLPLLLALRRQNRRYQFACHNRLLRYFCLILYNRTSIFIVK